MGQTNCSGAVGVVTDFPSYLTGDLADGDDFTPLRTAQPKSPTRTPMIAMTTSSSISVKPRRSGQDSLKVLISDTLRTNTTQIRYHTSLRRVGKSGRWGPKIAWSVRWNLGRRGDSR